MGQFGIGQAVTRIEDQRLLTGGGRYNDDISLKGQTYAYILRSPYSHAKINSIKTKKSIKESDLVIVKFGDQYKQWNAAFDAGYASALNKSIIVIHNEQNQHALKEVDAFASAVACDQNQVVRILKYILDGSLK